MNVICIAYYRTGYIIPAGDYIFYNRFVRLPTKEGLHTHEKSESHQSTPVPACRDEQGHGRPADGAAAEIFGGRQSLDQVGGRPHADNRLDRVSGKPGKKVIYLHRTTGSIPPRSTVGQPYGGL